MTHPQSNTEERLKNELKKVMNCAFRMGDPRKGWRFSFRVCNETFDEWQELIK